MDKNNSKNISLNGEWYFAVDSAGKFNLNNLNEAEWRNAKVPLSIQAQFEDLRDYQGISWYKRNFSLTAFEESKVVILKFDAVDYLAEVFINKKFVGKHEGGYTPFRFDISDFISKGNNEVIVRVLDPAATEEGTDGISYWHIPHGKQNWYVQTSGIWQNVGILIKPSLFVQKLHITPAIDGSLKIEINLNKPLAEKSEVKIKVIDPSGRQVLDKTREIAENKEFTFHEQIADPELWHFDHPNLYTVEVSLGEDKVAERIGFRSIEAKEKKLYLNGEPFYLIAALDQDFYSETIYTTPSEEFLQDEMLKAKKLGLNMLRCHIKVPDPLYLKTADELGLLVWYEIPNWDVFNSKAAERCSKTFDEMLERDWNHPSLVAISIINESWGIDLHKEAEREWLLKEFDRLKMKAEGRLIIDNSACWGNFHFKTDINDYHTYWSIPDHKEDFDRTITDFSKRPSWLFSQFGDSEETGDEPLVVSEFGNWGLPILPEKTPWWFERKFFDVDASLPEGFDERFKSFNYDKIFGSYNNLALESQRNQFNALKYEIETIRMFPEIQGYVITEFTDINWECNGLLDMWRNFKIYSGDLSMIQQQDIIIPRPVKYNLRNDEEVEIKIFISHYSKSDFNDIKVNWRSFNGDSGSFPVPFVKHADVVELPAKKFQLKAIEKSEKVRLHFELVNRTGEILAKNYTEVFVFCKAEQSAEKVNIYNPGNSLNQFRKFLEDDLFVLDDSASLIVTNIIDKNIRKRLAKGESVICLIDSNTSLTSPSLKIISRNENWYDGNWASNLNWMNREEELFKDLNFSNAFGFETAQTSPEWVMVNIPEDKFDNVLAGMFVGWIHYSAGYIVKAKAGKGRMILCAFPVAENYPEDPFAEILFNNMVKVIKNDNFNSTLTLEIN